MPDKPVRAIDPLGIVALANVLARHGNTLECSCELKCGAECSCELKCVCDYQCTCEAKLVQTDILAVLSNPTFREVVKGLDMNRMKSIEDFLAIADEIRTKMDAAKPPTRSTDKKKS